MGEYKNLKENFIKTLPENGEDNEELINGFNKFLYNMVSNLLDGEPQSAVNPFLYKEVVARAKYVINLSTDGKRAYLIEDQMLEKLKNISSEIFQKAVQKAEGKKYEFDKKQYKDIKSKLVNALIQVKPYNEDEANKIYSETLLDIEYLSGKDTASLRIGHIIRAIKEEQR